MVDIDLNGDEYMTIMKWYDLAFISGKTLERKLVPTSKEAALHLKIILMARQKMDDEIEHRKLYEDDDDDDDDDDEDEDE